MRKQRKASDGRTVTFQIDDTARAALEKLEAAAVEVSPGLLHARSAVIRSAIINEAARLGRK